MPAAVTIRAERIQSECQGYSSESTEEFSPVVLKVRMGSQKMDHMMETKWRICISERNKNSAKNEILNLLLVLWKNDLGVPRFQRKPAVLREPAQPPGILPARLYNMPPNSRLQILWLDFCSQLQKKAERKSDTEVIFFFSFLTECSL